MAREPKPGSQCDSVLTYIRRWGGITPQDAMGFGVYRLAARVHDLRDMGHRIITQDEPHNGGTHARYVLEYTDAQMEDAGQTSLFG